MVLGSSAACVIELELSESAGGTTTLVKLMPPGTIVGNTRIVDATTQIAARSLYFRSVVAVRGQAKILTRAEQSGMGKTYTRALSRLEPRSSSIATTAGVGSR